MLVQEVVLDSGSKRPQGIPERYLISASKPSKSDVAFPLMTPRRRVPSISSVTAPNEQALEQTGRLMGVLTIRATNSPLPGTEESSQGTETRPESQQDAHPLPISLQELPLEVQGKVLDYIFGDMHSVYAGSTSLRGKSVSSLMRHPRRKAVSDLALVSPTWRDLVQERIYRHIKIKGTRAGLKESEEFFCSHSHLTKLIRHIEFWVPVWGDKSALADRAVNPFFGPGLLLDGNNAYHQLSQFPVHERDLMPAIDMHSFNFKLCAYSATLSEIFSHISCFFPHSRVFTLEGGHCLNSNMIRHFPKTLFPDPHQQLEKLPNIRTFAMRGAWNIMRSYNHWKTIENALPHVEEWHCGYGRPQPKADITINDILTQLPLRLRHVNISLDGMYSKDTTTLGSSLTLPSSLNRHICQSLGHVLPRLESLSFTGKICECLWTSAISTLTQSRKEPRLRHLELVVKSCCRQRVSETDPETGQHVIHELGGVIGDGASITNLVFIKAFERLVLKTVEALPLFPALEYVRIRFIDIDSPCTLLNPYWLLQGGKVYGVWNEEIVERLAEVRPEINYVELGEGIECNGGRSPKRRSSGNRSPRGSGVVANGFGGVSPSRSGGGGSSCGLYPKWKPKSIKTSSYKIIAEARA